MDVYVGYVREWGGKMLVQEMELCQVTDLPASM